MLVFFFIFFAASSSLRNGHVCLSVRLSVRLSVCLSVCHQDSEKSFACILTKFGQNMYLPLRRKPINFEISNVPMSLPGITSMFMPKMKSISTAVNACVIDYTDRQTDRQTQCKNIHRYIYIYIYNVCVCVCLYVRNE